MKSSTRRLGRQPRSLAPLLLLIGLAGGLVQADTFTWDGSSNGNWGTGANWDKGSVPQSGDDLVFPAGPTRLATTNNTSTTRRYNSIRITGANYALRGNSLTLSNGLTATYGAGASASVALDLTLAQPQSIECTTDNSILYVTGDIALGSHRLIADANGNLLFGGAISGTGGIAKYGGGYLRLYGSTANTYSGTTLVNVGTLEFNKTSGVNALGGVLVVGNNTGDPETARWLRGAQLPGTTDVTVNAGALLDLNDFNQTVGGLILAGGKVETGTGTLTLGGDVTAGGVDGLSTIRGKVSLGTATRTFEILPDPDGSYPQMYIYATIGGSGGILKTGSGALSLAGTNTYGGLTFVSDGALVVDASAALGATASGTVVGAGGELHLRGNAQVGNESLSLTGLGPASPAHFTVACYGGTSNSWAGPVTLVNEVGISINPDTILEFTGPIGGTGGFTTVGLGTLVLSGAEANTFTGDVRVNTGALHLGKTITDGALPGPGALIVGDRFGGAGADVVREARNYQIDDRVDITINESGLLNLAGHSDTVGRLNLASGYIVTGAGTLSLAGAVVATSTTNYGSVISGHLAVNVLTQTFTLTTGYWSPDLYIPAEVSGSANLLVTGDGGLMLAASNSFTGAVTVEESALLWPSHTWALGTADGGTLLNGYARLGFNGDVHIKAEPLTMNSASPVGAFWVEDGSNSWAGPITLSRETTVEYFSERHPWFNLVGPISGPGGLTLKNAGTLILSGSTGNTFGGDTQVDAGTLLLGKTAGTGVAIRYGTLFIGDGVGGANADVVRFMADNQLWSTVPVFITNSGWLDLNGHDDIVGPITFSAGRASSGTGGLLRLGGDVTARYVSSGRPSLEGNLLLFANRTFDIANSSGSPDFDLSAVVSGDGGFTKTGAGALAIHSANSFSGTATLDDGLVYLHDNEALGSTEGGTIVNDGGVLVLANNRDIGAEPLTLNGNGDGIAGALTSIGGSNSWAGRVTLATDSVITVQTNRFLNLLGELTGPAGFTKRQPGTLILSGPTANTYAGDTRVDAGTLVLNKSGSDLAVPGNLLIGDGGGGLGADLVRLERPSQIANAADVTLSSSGRFDLNGQFDRIDAVTGSGSITLDSGHLVAGHSGSSFTFDGLVSGTGYLWKVGDGTWTLTADNTYSGTTLIETGTLLINGAQPASDVLIENHGRLGGTGIISRVTSTGGALSPGLSPGTLTSSNVLFDSSSDLVIELTEAGADQLNVRGKVGLADAHLVLAAPGLLPVEGQAFVIINNDETDAVTGTFAGLPEGAGISAGPRQFRLTYQGGTGNDVVLIATNTAALRPPLAIWRTPTNTVVLAWPQSDIAWRLHAATNLVPSGSLWTEIPPPYASNFTDCLVTEPVSTSNRVYRLHMP